MSKLELMKSLRQLGMQMSELANKTEEELVKLVDSFDCFGNKKPEIKANAFDSYKQEFEDDVSKYGLESTYMSWAAGAPCGCMGPQDGDPYCPCEMRCKTASMFAKVVPVKE